MAPRPRKNIDSRSLRQADAVVQITGPWLKELIRNHVLGNGQGLPTSEACNLFAHYLEFMRWLYQVRPRWKERDDSARASWEAISFLLKTLPTFCDHANASIEAMQGWEDFGPVESKYLDLRKAQLSAHQDAIRRIHIAIEGLHRLESISPEATPFRDQCLTVPRIAESWHDYSADLARQFIKFMEPISPGLKLSNNGPVAKFVWHLIPSISGESVGSFQAVAKHLQREAKGADGRLAGH